MQAVAEAPLRFAVKEILVKKIAALGLVVLFSAALSAAQDDPKKIDWKACEKEIQEYQCKGTDEEIWTCLEQHDDKLSEGCQAPHAKGDELFKQKKS